VDDRLETKPVTFNMGNSMVPTLVQKLESSSCYGYEAQISRRKAKLYQNFKVKLESSDEAERMEARALTEEFFKYLADEYKAQSEGGFFGAASDQEKTIVSYPVKWSDETKNFMIEAAKKAGFKNVEGMDEAQAAIQAITVQNADMLSRKGYFTAGQPVNILLVDMGAGTTDMVLCRHTPGESGNTQILATWPKDGNVLFGGHEVDELLVEYMRKKLPEDEGATFLKKFGVEKFKAWKENTVSGALARQESVDYFSDLDSIVEQLEIDMEPYALNRAEFETLAAEYLKGLPELLKGCLNEAKRDGAQIDLVILTGGHSQWYFARELLLNKETGLSKIAADANRLVSIVRPQETVALGLTYGPLVNELWLARVKKDGKYGFIDKAGTLVIPYRWDFARDFSDGLASVKKDGKYGFIDKTGNLVIPCQWDEAYGFYKNGLSIVKRDGKCGWIDKTGALVIPCQWDDAWGFEDGLARVKRDGKYGFIDTTGSLVIPSRWDDAWGFEDGLARVKRDGKWGFIDTTGALVIPCQWDETYGFNEGLAAVKKDFKWGFIDTTGSLVIPCRWSRACNFHEGLASVSKAGEDGIIKDGFIDKTGTLVIPCQWDEALSFKDGLARVKKHGKFLFDEWGSIDKTGNLVIPFETIYYFDKVSPCQWKRIGEFHGGLARVEKDGKYGFIDKTGNLVIPCQWNDAGDFS